MDLASLLANERRARLAAERLLEMRQGELKAANRKLAEHARLLSNQVIAKRDEVATIQNQTESLRDEYAQTRDDLARAHSAAELAEGRLWSALQSVRDGFALFDADQRLVVANRSYLTVFDGLESVRPGITYAEIVRIMADEGIIDPQGPPDRWVQAMIDRWEAPDPPSVVLRLWNGQFVKLVDRRTPDGGKVTLGVNQTDQLRMWAAVEAIPDGFVLFDQDDRLVMCNQRYREIYPESAEAMVPGATFEEILHCGLKNGQFTEALGREEQWLEERLSEHRLANRVLEQPLAGGRWLRILEKATPDGGRVGLRVDISEIKSQQAALEAERERAEAASRAKSAFLANMSHEIRTPMNGVVGMADLLQSSALTAEQALCVSTIRSSGEALLAILNDILDFSRLEARKMPLAPRPFDLEDCVHEVVRLLQPSVVDRDIAMGVVFAPDQPPVVRGDPGRIRQILTNLVGNALKFTEAGRVDVRVGPGDDGVVRITVADTGIGIPEDKLDHVFGEFNQVEDDRNRRYDGTGLGLAISRQLAEQMGGAITVTSRMGEGSRFTVTLPLPPAELPGGAGSIGGHVTRAVIVAPPGDARAGLAAQLSALGLACDERDAGLSGLGAGDAVFVLAEGRETAPPAIDGPRPLALILVTSKPVRGGQAEGFDRVLSRPLSRNAILATLNGLTAPGPAMPPPPGGAMLRVLAAEDNKTNQLVLRKMLKDAQIDLTLVDNGAEAVAAFRSGPPDLVFMDISMPGMDGREAARLIRAFEAENHLPRTPIVAMTAHAMSSDKAEIAAAGIDHHLSKPLNRASLLDHVAAVRAGLQVAG
ncbi:PAS-domain containing protein [Oceaniglobus trochenteri]|uniref:PAS-domain containing protein n=1 Tax=Oceaniglobus trochenteri TaxID=2763260 RepID=UPI001CFF61C5|nr:PAS-domain containing protein [Oceaniglobus trochenteri]